METIPSILVDLDRWISMKIAKSDASLKRCA